MPPKHKTVEQKEQARTEILNAARDLFVAKGVEAVTMREIAKRVGCSATALYLHFADKDALIKTICATDFLTLANRMQTVMQIDDPVERLNLLGLGYAEFALSHPEHYRFMFMTPQVVCIPESHELEQGNPEEDGYALLTMLVRIAFEAGCFREDITEPDLIAQTLWAGIHGVCALEITKQGDPWVEWQPIQERVALMQTTLIRGLLRAKS